MKNNLLAKLIKYFECFLTWLIVIISSHKFNHQIYRFNFPEVWYSPWNHDDGDFASIYAAISRNTLVSKRKLYDLFCISKQFNRIGGNFLEVGTLRGGTAALLASVFSGESLVLWDNWGEYVQQDDYFIEKVYSKDNDLVSTRDLLKRIAPSVLGRVSFVNQSFPVKSVIAEWNDKFSLVHFDIYDKTAFETGISMVWPKIKKGGCFIVSAYGSISLDPLTVAVNEFVQCHKDCLFIQTQSGLGVLIKLTND